MSVWAYVLGMAALFVLVGGFTLPISRDDDHDYLEMLQLQQRVTKLTGGDKRAAALLADLQLAEAVYTVRMHRRAVWRLTSTTTSSLLVVASIMALFF